MLSWKHFLCVFYMTIKTFCTGLCPPLSTLCGLNVDSPLIIVWLDFSLLVLSWLFPQTCKTFMRPSPSVLSLETFQYFWKQHQEENSKSGGTVLPQVSTRKEGTRQFLGIMSFDNTHNIYRLNYLTSSWPLHLFLGWWWQKAIVTDCCLLTCVKWVDDHSVSSGQVHGSHLAALVVVPEKWDGLSGCELKYWPTS